MNPIALFQLLPKKLRTRLQTFLRSSVAPYSCSLPSGVLIEIGNRSDWAIFSEIFLLGEYDQAIALALQGNAGDKSDLPFVFLDIGANVGYFTAKLLQERARLNRPRQAFKGLLVEAAPQTYQVLRRRLDRLPDGCELQIVHGAAGEREGVASLSSVDGGHPVRTIVGNGANPEGESIHFVNLDAYTKGWDRVDLLKCDIEGAEELFFSNYPNLLAAAQVIVCEIHPDLCDAERVYQLLSSAGHRRISITRKDDSSGTVEVFAKT
jgi:FkbM family methyltransferase